MRSGLKPVRDAYYSLCLEVITSAVDDIVYYRNATTKDKQGRHWNERMKDGKMATAFLLSDFNIYFDYVELRKDLVIEEMLKRLHDPDAWGTS